MGIEILLKKTKSVKYFSGQGVGDVNGQGGRFFPICTVYSDRIFIEENQTHTFQNFSIFILYTQGVVGYILAA